MLLVAKGALIVGIAVGRSESRSSPLIFACKPVGQYRRPSSTMAGRSEQAHTAARSKVSRRSIPALPSLLPPDNLSVHVLLCIQRFQLQVHPVFSYFFPAIDDDVDVEIEEPPSGRPRDCTGIRGRGAIRAWHTALR